MLDILKYGKTMYTETIAHEIVSLEEKDRRVPAKIKDLFNQIPVDTEKTIESQEKNP